MLLLGWRLAVKINIYWLYEKQSLELSLNGIFFSNLDCHMTNTDDTKLKFLRLLLIIIITTTDKYDNVHILMLDIQKK